MKQQPLNQVINYNGEPYYDLITHEKDIVHFYSNSCGPCKMIDEILIDYPNVIRVNVDEYLELVDNLNIKCVPTIYIYKEGSLTDKIEGYKNKELLINLLNK
ncbi:MAG: thioredoxin family protein [Bacilli bacterium]|nr:thioredoxin family protein [Bacilli bacterium]